MKTFVIAVSSIVSAFMLFVLLFVQRIDYGNVGVRFNLIGDDKGVSTTPITPGYALVNPFTQRVYEYPIVTQNLVYEKELRMSFNANDGAQLSADVGMSYAVKQDKVVDIFKKFRNNLESILHGYVRILVRDTLNEVASSYKATEIFGDKKQIFMSEFQKQVQTKLDALGFTVDQCTILGEIECSERVRESVNKVIEASQKSMEAEQKIRQSEAEAKQKIAEAEGEAQAILTRAKAQAEANELVNKSLTPELVRYKLVEKWDGKAPQVLGQTEGMIIPLK